MEESKQQEMLQKEVEEILNETKELTERLDKLHTAIEIKREAIKNLDILDAVVCSLPNGCCLYRKPNGVGGFIYYSDEVGCRVTVWDTCAVDESTLLAAIVAEHSRKIIEKETKHKTEIHKSGSCPSCGRTKENHTGTSCDMVFGRRGWRQLGVYDG